MEPYSYTQSPSQHTPLLSQSSKTQDAGLVFVRIISKNDDNTYTVSVHGQRITVHTESEIEPGTTFRARITSAGAKIIITPADPPQAQQNTGAFKITDSASLNDTRAASYFSVLGLPSNPLSLRIAQFIMQSGIKYTPHQMRKAYSTAARFTGSEENASAATLLLEGKNIPADIETITAVLEILFGGKGCKDNLLSTVNGSKTSPRSWSVIPFDYTFSESAQALTGSVRILHNEDSKKTEKITVSAFAADCAYHFSALFATENKSLKFCIEPEPSESQIIRMKEELAQILEKTAISSILYSRSLSRDFFDSSDTDILIVREKV